MTTAEVGPVALHEWYAISAVDEINSGTVYRTMLLGESVRYTRRPGNGNPVVWHGTDDDAHRRFHGHGGHLPGRLSPARCDAPGRTVIRSSWSEHQLT
jgi:hypothetical protein